MSDTHGIKSLEGVNFIKILLAAFSFESIFEASLCLVCVCNFLWKENWHKVTPKRLVKLTNRFPLPEANRTIWKWSLSVFV